MKRSISKSVLLVAALLIANLILPQPLSAHEINFTDRQGNPLLAFKVPDGWTVTFDNDKLFFVSPTAENRIITWEIPTSKSRNEAELYLRTLSDTLLVSPKLVQETETYIADIPVKLVVMTGQPSMVDTVTGEDATLTALILEPRPNTYFAVISLDSNSTNDRVAPILMDLVCRPGGQSK